MTHPPFDVADDSGDPEAPTPAQREIDQLRLRLQEAEETLSAIRNGEVDALVVTGGHGAKVYTLQSAEQPYRILIEQMQEGAATLSSEGVILYCNLRLAELLRMPHEKVLASELATFVSPPEKAIFNALLRAAQSNGGKGELYLCASDGTPVPVVLTISPLPSEEGNVCLVVTDLTEQKQREEILAAERLARSINERLRRAVQETHHRVKNNLQIVSALAEMQLEESGATVPGSALRRISQHARSLAAIHDLLTIQSKVDAEADTISTQATMDKLVPLLQSTAGGKRIRCTADAILLSMQQIGSLCLLVNELVSNAVKHGEGDIDIRLTQVYTPTGNQARLTVGSEGGSFPPDFDPLRSAHTGLGLIDATGRYDLRGTVTYENPPEGGSRVTVSFPISSAIAPE